MATRDFLLELAKYAFTGLATFGASALYTQYQLEPKRNISVIPLSIETLDSCDVGPAELEDASKRSLTNAGDYNSYLQALSKSRPPSGHWIVQKRLVPEELLPQLETDRVLKCSGRDKDNHPDPRYNTFLVLQAAVVMEQPNAYLLKRSCSLTYEGEKIPLNAFAEAIELRPLGGGAVSAEPEALMVRGTNNLILQYDTRNADQINQKAFANLISSKEPVDLSLRCTVVHAAGGSIEIGGERLHQIKAPLSLR